MAQTMAEGDGFGALDLRGTASRRRRERTMKAIFFAAAAFCVVLSVLIVASVAGGFIQFLSKVEFGTLWSS